VRAAYRAQEDMVEASLISVDNQLNGDETHTSAALARSRTTAWQPLITPLISARSAEEPQSLVR
jgi:hypothetical protein